MTGKKYFALFILLAAVLTASMAMAQPAADARQELSTAINRILDNLKNPAYENPDTRGPIRQAIEKEVYQVFDFGEFSSRTVGPRWKTFSAEDKKRFENAFANLLFNTYLNKVTGYHGEKINYTGETVSPNGDLVEVKTRLVMKDGKETPVNYRMLLKNGHWRVYDVIIENISLVRNYRTQFQDILKTASPTQLIERINQKTQEIIAQGETQTKSGK